MAAKRTTIPHYLNYNEVQVTVDSVAGSPGDDGVFVRYADGLLVFMDLDLFIHQATQRSFMPESARVAVTGRHILLRSKEGGREAICSALVRSFYDHDVEFQLNTAFLDIGREWGKRIQLARHRNGMTQIDLAEAAEMKQSAISRIESGAHVPQFETIDRIAWALGIPPFELALLGSKDIPLPFWGRVGQLREPRRQRLEADDY